MLNSIIISPTGEEIICKYSEINEISRRIIENVCYTDRNISEKFLEFSKDYTYFESYFDFLLFELGYKIKNPFNIENATVYAKDDLIYLNHLNQNVDVFCKSNDKEIGLEILTESNMNVSMVDGNLIAIKPPKFKKHNLISRLILNNFFIKDECLFEKYVKEVKDIGFYYFDFINFLMNNFSYFRLEKNVKTEKTKSFAVFKNCDYYYIINGYEDTMTEKQKKFIDEVISKNIIETENVAIMPSERRKNL